MQTISFLLFRLHESSLGSQDILSEKPWKLEKKICWNHFYIRGKRQHTGCPKKRPFFILNPKT